MGTPDLATLKSTLVSNNTLVGWCTVAVFLGLLVEYTILLWPKWRELKRWEKLFTVLAGLAIAGGVYGEYLFGSRAADAALQIENISESRVAELNAKAEGSAKESAQFRKEAAGLGKQAEDEKTARLIIQRRVTEASERVEQLRKANNEASARLEEERKKRVELAASLLPRHFSDQSGAIQRLAGFPSIPVVFEYVDERDPRGMAEEIYFVTGGAMRWPGFKRRVNDDLIPDGITISPGSKYSPPNSKDFNDFVQYVNQFKRETSLAEAAAIALRDGLRASGLDAEIGERGYDLAPLSLLVEVGFKPNHALESTLKELGPPIKATPIGRGRTSLGANRATIPDEPVPDKKPQ